MIINKLPVPTWRFLRGNEVSIEWEETGVPPCLVEEEGEKVCISSCADSLYSQGEFLFHLAEGEKKILLQVISPCESKKLQVKNKIVTEKGAKFTLVQLFLGGEKSVVVHEIDVVSGESSSVQVVQLMLGRGDLYSHVQSELLGEKSEFFVDIAYIVENQLLDMNLLVNHRAKESRSEINLEGLIKEKGKKVFRGTIDLRNGATGSVGKEQENVLLLGEDIQNLTIPVLLCSEEDVQGAHGAAIGELDEETLFYLNSRGIGQKTAEIMMSQAKIQRVIQKIPSESVGNQVREILKEVLGDD